MTIRKVNLAEKFSQFQDHWSPKIVGEIDRMYVKLVKVQGDFIWHRHEEEDELFFIVKGRLLMKLRDSEIWLEEGEFVVIPKGTEHCPVAEEEVHMLVIEPKTTLNTGTVIHERTVHNLERL